MQFYFLTRGNSYDVDVFTNFLKSIPFTIPIYKEGTNEIIGNSAVFGILRPVQLWEFCAPKEAYDEVVNSLQLTRQIYPDNLKMKMAVKGIQKALSAEPFKNPLTTAQFLVPINNMKNIQIVPLGFREDKNITYDGKTHEGI